MVCSNCKSDNVIRVQNQLFCVNCGNLVEQSVEPPDVRVEGDVDQGTSEQGPSEQTVLPSVSATKALHVAVKPETPTVKRRPGRPKAGSLDAPRPDKAVPTTVPVPDKPVGLVSNRSASSATPVNQEHRDSVAGAEPFTSKPGHHLGYEARARASDAAEELPYKGVISASFRSHLRPAHYFLSVAPAGIIGLIVAGATYGLTTGSYQRASWTPDMSAVLAVEAVLIGAVYYFARSLSQGAMLYGAARQADHRPAPVSIWLDAAAAGQGRRLRYDTVCGLLQGAITAAIIGVIVTGGQPLGIPLWAQVGAVFTVLLCALYVWAGLALAHGFGRVAVTLSNVPSARALALGWGFFRRHFMLVGLRTVSLLLEALLALPLLVCLVAALWYFRTLDQVIICLLVGLCAAITGAAAGAGSAAWWYAAYRRLVRLDRLAQSGQLLAANAPSSRSARQLLDWVALIVILAGLAAVLPLISGI